MSNVSTKYYAAASQNLSLGNLSLKENETRFRDINDLFRRLMADIRQESDEVRRLIAASDTKAANAKSAAENTNSTVEEIQQTVYAIQSESAKASEDASQAVSTANAAQDTIGDIASSVAAISGTSQSNASAIEDLASEVDSLRNAASSSATLVQVDGTSVSNTNGVLKAIDVKVGETTASALGQIGRTKVSTGADLDGIIADGWYAVGGENATGLPAGVVSGICRVSSGYASETCFQTLFSVGESPRMFVRSTSNDGAVWTDWSEAVFGGAVGSGLTFANGVLQADLSEVLPEAGTDDADKALSGAGTWMEVAHPADVQAAFEAVSELEEAVETLRADIETMQASVAAEPDGETVVVEDGKYAVPQYYGATSEEAGTAGLVPPADAGEGDLFLRGDGEWADPQMSTQAFSGSDAGLVPPADEGDQTLFLRGDGVWADPAAELSERVEELESLDMSSFGDRIAVLEEMAELADIDAIFAEPGIEEEEGEGEGEGGGEGE